MEKQEKPAETKKPKDKKLEYREGDMVMRFKLKRITEYQTPLMKEWLGVENPVLNAGEQYNFDRKLQEAIVKIAGWSDEDLKMKFISAILDLGHISDGDDFVTFFDKTVSAVVDGTKLTVKSDFMVAKGFLDVFTTPYFHFQEYKPQKNPSGDSMGQLLEAFMIAQVNNADDNPLYGVEIIGKQWSFVIMEGKEYCVSQPFICTDKEDLLKIIAVLRKFRHILETKLMVKDE